MLFGDVIAIALSILGFLLSLQGLWLVCGALWPARVASAAGWCAGGSLKCFLLGLPVSVVTLLVAAVVAKTFGTFGQLAGFSLGLLFLVYANVGTAGFVTHIGWRLASPADAERPWKATIRGGAALELAWLLPVLGWLGLLPISLILGAGATTLALFGSPRRVGASAAFPTASAPIPAAPLPAPLPAPAPLPQAAAQATAQPTPQAAQPMPPLPKAAWARPPSLNQTELQPAELQPAEPAGVEG